MNPDAPKGADAAPSLRLVDPESPAPQLMGAIEAKQMRNQLASKLFGKTAEPVKIGRFSIRKRVGAGGMGVVYEGRDEALERRVAIKILHPRSHEGDEGRRMVREAQALARLSHPNVLQVYEVGEHEGQVFLAMEFIEGGSLRGVCEHRSAPLRVLIDPWLQAARGLAAAHDAGLVHRDFKPDNALRGTDGRVRVADFGLAAATPPPELVEGERLRHHNDGVWDDGADSVSLGLAADSARSNLEHSLTVSGTLLGTPAYMSPEQHLCLRADTRSDQFSFCIALYEALLGFRPFQGKALPELADAVCSTAYSDPAALRRLPPRLRRLLQRGLAREPDARFPDMHTLVAELELIVAPRRRGPLLAGLGLCAGLAAVFAWPGQDAAAQCQAQAEAELAPLWSEQREAKLSAQLKQLPVAYAPTVTDRLMAKVQAYAESWTQARSQLCQASRSNQLSPLALGQQQLCLAQAHAALGGLVEVFESTPANGLRRSLLTVDELPRPAACRHGDHSEQPPDDGETRAKLLKLESLLARAQQHLTLRQIEQGVAVATEARTLADDMATPRNQARARRVLGELKIVGNEFAEGLDLVGDALRLADTARDDETRARALIARIRGLIVQGNYKAAERSADDAWAIVDRLQGEPRLLAELHFRQGLLDARQGRYCEALDHSARTLKLRRGLYGDHSYLVARDHVNYGHSLRRVGREGDAREEFELAYKAFEASVGLDHPEVANALASLGILQLSLAEALNDPEQSRRARLRALDYVQKSVAIRDVPVMRNNLGWIELGLGHHKEALKHYRAALEGSKKRFGEQHPRSFRAISGLAQTKLAAATDRPALMSAIAELERAAALAQQLGSKISAEEVAELHAARARAQARLRTLGGESPNLTATIAQAEAEYQRALKKAVEEADRSGCGTANEVERLQRLSERFTTWAQQQE